MRKKLTRAFLASLMVGTVSFSLVGCGGSSEEASTGEIKEITIPTFMAGENVGGVFFLPQIERFNEKYEGVYKINIEETPESGYGDKIKQLAQQQKMPALVHGPIGQGVDKQWFREVAVANDLVYDLSSFLDENQEIKEILIDESLEFCTVDDKVICMPAAVTRPIGLYYNEALMDGTTIKEMSMDEFIASLGENKIAFMTADDSWTTGLFFSAILANEEGGYELLQQHAEDKLYDYTHPAFVSAIEKLQKLTQTNGASNTVGAAYPDAANAFMSNNASIIANGSWMAGEFSPEGSGNWSNGFDGSTVSTTIYPGNIALANTKVYGDFFIPNSASEDEKEVALEFIKFRYSQEELEAYMLAEGGMAPKLTYTDEFLKAQGENKILSQLTGSIDEETKFVVPIQDAVPTSIVNPELGKLLPKLIDNSMTAQEFCEALTVKGQEILQ